MQQSYSDLESKIYQSLNALNSKVRNKNIARNPLIIKRKVNSFRLYHTYLDQAAKILDWGCGDSVVSLMIRETSANPEIQIHGCDLFDPPPANSTLFEQTRLIYTALKHPYVLPYQDSYFDAVVANGVLEHAPNDYESMKELYRVIQIDGFFIITFLPNRRSYSECINQVLHRFISKKHCYHRRRYTLNDIKHMLLHSGFEPICWGYHQLIPSLTSLQTLYPNLFERIRPIAAGLMTFDSFLQKIWPINLLSANIFIVSQKRQFIL